jgi:hypothetical protein
MADAFAINTFPPERVLILTRPGDEAAAYLMAANFWRWLGQRINVGGDFTAFVLKYQWLIVLAVLALAWILGAVGITLPDWLSERSNLNGLVLVGAFVGGVLLTIASSIIAASALVLGFGPSSVRLTKEVEIYVAATPPGKWTIVQLEPWPLAPESGALVHASYDDPDAVREICDWIKVLASRDPAPTDSALQTMELGTDAQPSGG